MKDNKEVRFEETMSMSEFVPPSADQPSSTGSAPEPEALDYDLFAVLMHSGSAMGGHYFAYIKPNAPEGPWFSFDDSAVTSLHDVNEPLKLAFGGSGAGAGASAYMLMYQRRQTDASAVAPTAYISSLPASLCAVVEAEDAEFQRQRQEYLAELRMLDITVVVANGNIEQEHRFRFDMETRLGDVQSQVIEAVAPAVGNGLCRLRLYVPELSWRKESFEGKEISTLKECGFGKRNTMILGNQTRFLTSACTY